MLSHLLPRQRRLASGGNAKPSRWGHSALPQFKLNIDGDRIAGRKRCFQRLVKQFIQMCRRGCRTFLRFFPSEHDVGALFPFWLLSILDVCTGHQRGPASHEARSESRFYDRGCLHQRRNCLVANRLTAAWKQGRQAGGRGYYESDPASGVAVSVVNVNPPRLERTSPEATCSPLSWTVRLDRKWRRGRSCYVTFLLNPRKSI